MKRLLLFASLALFTAGMYAQEGIKWMSIEEAVALNQKEPKKFMIDVYTDWCGWCKRMDAGTFTDQGVIDYVNENFHAVKLNAEQKEDIVLGNNTYKFVADGRRGYNELAAILLDGRMGYPSIVYLDENASRITVSPGYKMPDGLKTELVFVASEAYKKTDFESFSADYKKEKNLSEN